MTAKNVATSGVRGKLGEVQRFCKDSGEAVSTTIVETVVLARKGVEAKTQECDVVRPIDENKDRVCGHSRCQSHDEQSNLSRREVSEIFRGAGGGVLIGTRETR